MMIRFVIQFSDSLPSIVKFDKNLMLADNVTYKCMHVCVNILRIRTKKKTFILNMMSNYDKTA